MATDDQVRDHPRGPRSICVTGSLATAAEKIADSATSINGSLSATAEKMAETATSIAGVATSVAGALTVPKESHAQKQWRLIRLTVVILTTLIASGFALEQYFATRYQAEQVRLEGQLTAACEALGNSDSIVQANAVRSLARIGQYSTYAVPSGIGSVGRHVRAAFGYSSVYPYSDQSRSLLKDFATSRKPAENSLVSSEILRECAAWENRSRPDNRVSPNQTRGSLLFKAELGAAVATDLDLSGIQFGGANLDGANLSGSDCSRCGFLGARLTKCKLRNTTLTDAYLAETHMNEADLSFAKLRGADLRKASLEKAVFLQTDLSKSRLNNAVLNGAVFNQAALAEVDFSGSSLCGAVFRQSDVSTAKFDNADVLGADFTLAIGFSQSLLSKARNSSMALVPQSLENTK